MKTISLSNKKQILIDQEDFEKISQYKWWYLKNDNCEYAFRQKMVKGKIETILLHRVILNVRKGEFIDHINGNGLDNRKSNLRIVTHAQNMANRKLHKNNTSGYKGVSRNKKSNRYYAGISINGQNQFLGSFKYAKDAGYAYDQMAKKEYGEFARLNFAS